MIDISNYERYPNNVFKPINIANGYKLYLVRFNSLYDLYDFLKSNPQINHKVFYELGSIDGSYDFAGVPYEEAVENLVREIKDNNFDNFLKIQSSLDNCINIPVNKYRTINTLAGGHLNIPAYSSGTPLCYETEERIMKPKFVKANVLLSYRFGTTKEQVFNRAIIIINVLKALEKAGYKIDLNTFSLARCNYEYIHVVVKIKDYNEKLNMASLYKTLCQVEFLRRIIFRLREITDVKDSWNGGYGTTCDVKEVKSILKCDDNELFFGQPDEVGVYGENLEDDFDRMIDSIGLGDKINIEEAKKNFNTQVKRLTRGK